MTFRIVPVLVGLAGGIVSIITNIHIISKGGKGKNGSSVAVSNLKNCFIPHYS